MSTRTRTCYITVCDSCGQDIEVDYDGVTMHFESPDEARSEIRTAGVGGSSPEGDFCSRCATKPHAFVEHDSFADECSRCCEAEEDHVPAVEPVAAEGRSE